MNPAGLAKILASLIAMLGPAPADMPKELQLKTGDQIVAIGDSITQDGGLSDATSTWCWPRNIPT